MPKDDFDVWFIFGPALEAYAEDSTGSVEVRDWADRLPAADFDALLLFLVDAGYRQNSGSFTEAVISWADFRDELKRALTRFGCMKAAELVDSALVIGERREREEDTSEMMLEREEIDRVEDFTHRKVISYLTEHADAFSIDIRPML